MSRNAKYIKMINSSRWKHIRIKKLMECPLCEQCAVEEKISPATEVHHILPVESVSSSAQMESLMFSYANLMSLCHTCHAGIHKQLFSHTKESVKSNNKRKTESFINKYLK